MDKRRKEILLGIKNSDKNNIRKGIVDLWPAGWGHTFRKPKEKELLQIYLQPNGINLDDNIKDIKIKIALQKMKDLGVGLINMPETNLDWKIEKVREQYGYRIKKHWPISRSTFAASKVRAKGERFLPGGAASTVVGKWASRCLDSGQDSTGMGRWTWQRLRGKEGKIITQITAYRVPQETPPGPTSAYMQQWDHMIGKDIVNPDPKGQFLVDLEEFIMERRILGEHIILALDANEPLVDKHRPGKITGIKNL